MKKKWNLAALLPGFLSLNSAEAIVAQDADTHPKLLGDGNDIVIAPLNVETPLYIAGHRSHSSHSSHRSSSSSSSGHSSHSSHRSSSGSGSRSYTPSYPSSTRSDPLGAPSTPSYTSPSNSSTSTAVINKVVLIKRVQIALKILGYYNGRIDGINGPNTRRAIQQYRIVKGLDHMKIIDAELLNSLGISAP